MKERPVILQTFLGQKAQVVGWGADETLLREGGLDDWGGQVDGYSVADLRRLVDRACAEAAVDASASIGPRGEIVARGGIKRTLALEHLDRAGKGFVPTAMANQTFFTSEVRLSDIGGMEEQKRAIMDMLTLPTKYAPLVDRAPVRGRKGLMLVGPPGCGKTMLVHAAARETKGLLRFLTVKGPELLSKYIGASEAGVRQVFERAQAAAPSVVFFDEIEALAPKRGADSTGVTDRVVNQMLCYLDGVEERGRVYVIAATGRPDLVDAALMRPGRFDKICYCGLPSDDDKFQCCEVLATKQGVATLDGADLKVELRRLVAALPPLFTCADLDGLFASAKIEAVTASLRSVTAEGESLATAAAPQEAPKVTFSNLYSALSTAKASVSQQDERRYAKVFAPYRAGGRPGTLGQAKAENDEPQVGVKVALA